MMTRGSLAVVFAIAFLSAGGAQRAAAAEPRNFTMFDLCFTPDGTKLVTSGDRIRVFDLATQKLLPDSDGRWKGLTWGRKIRVSPVDGDLLAVALDSGQIRLLRLGTGELVRKFETDPGTVHDLQFSSDGRMLALATSQIQNGMFVHGKLRILEVETGKQLYDADREESNISAIAFSRDGERVAFTSGPDLEVFELHPWNSIGTVRLPVGNFEGQGDPFGLSATFLKDSDRLLVAGGICRRGNGGCNPTGLLWDIDLQGEARLDGAIRPSYIRSVSAAPEGSEFVIGFHEGAHQRVSLCDANHDVLWTTEQKLADGSGEMYGLKISPDGKTVAWCSGEFVHVVSGKTGDALFSIQVTD